MQYQLSFPKTVQATIQLPSSKSISNRALIINALADGKIPPENLSDCDDTRVMIKALSKHQDIVDIMAAGTAMRFLTAYFSVTPGTRIITGTERMKQRPIHILVKALRQLGAEIEYTENEGYPPLRITGKELTGSEISLPGNVSSQYISALLMIAPTLKHGLEISLTGEVISLPYINLTLQLMKEFGVEAVWKSENNLRISPQSYQSISYLVESDWSAASYWYQIAALADEAEITLPGLLCNSFQGDRRGADVFEKLGVKTTFTPKGAILTKKEKSIERLEEDFSDIPDLAQTFAVTCALLNIPFRFTGLQTLKIKETDRIAALITELAKLGYVLKDENDSVLIWNEERTFRSETPIIKTYEDHRMAMAFAPASMYYPQIIIDEPGVVSKSYPQFWNNLKEAGIKISLKEPTA
ncbi:3-phosphoshikimate 1-carboxyvinyltransferase [Bacteroides sp. OttesenSCG-928-J23]|nr:3-phosphoshikimate 1-carboxyvinyltransferase [Bacteroides sp. OttesenSCG-928-N06]MDL2247679.1 3-phosphoshikimate 1-carboxyvinyltransferase [Bacteroides sp. OttesenSCG-928-J23]MDL2305426.1 3-phosphoshikimate 1-carboxyvinyltransferase [Bacteroides sp. OttesenSCG-928-D19]